MNTAELMELSDFVKKAEQEITVDLAERLRTIIEKIIFLSDYLPLTSFEIKTNNSAFQWYKKSLIDFRNFFLDFRKVEKNIDWGIHHENYEIQNYYEIYIY